MEVAGRSTSNLTVWQNKIIFSKEGKKFQYSKDIIHSAQYVIIFLNKKEKNQVVEIDLEMSEIIESADRDFAIALKKMCSRT